MCSKSVKKGYQLMNCSIRARHWLLASCVLGGWLLPAGWGQGTPGSTGSVQGTVVTDTGAGIASATVALLPLTTSSGPVRTTISLRTGAFTVNSVPAGRYEVCARPATAAYADSCFWGTHRIIANVPAPAGAQPIVILLKKASLLKVRLNDSATFLQRLPTENVPPHVVVGVWGRRFLAAREVKKDSTGIDYELAVPADTALSFRLYSQKVRLLWGGTGAGSSPVPPQGYSTVLFFDSKKPAPASLTVAAVGRLP
jgi:hypothetical protein